MALTFNNGFVPFAIFSASILGSTHCVAMCSGLILAVAPTKQAKIFYHLGRGVGYVMLGSMAGFFGNKIFASERFNFLSWLGVAFLSLSLIFLGFKQFLNSSVHFKLPKIFSTLYSRLWKTVSVYRESAHGLFFMGWMSSFLPCGWLYSFVLGAATMQSPALGAAALFLFWLGTLPALSFGSLAMQKILTSITPMKGLAPKSAGVLLMLAGFTTIGLRAFPLLAQRQAQNIAAPPTCILHIQRE